MERTKNGNYKILAHSILKGGSDRGNAGHDLTVWSQRRGQFEIKLASDMGSKMTERAKDRIDFKFNLIIKDLKNFTNLISELKQREFNFKIIRHENKKKNAFTQKIFKYFKKN